VPVEAAPPARSLFARLALLIALVAAIAVAALWAVTDWAVRAESRTTLLRVIDTDIAGLADIYAAGGRDELEARLADRLALAPLAGDPPHYLLADASGRALAGDIASWPALAAEASEAGTMTVADATEGRAALARATQLGPDTKLVVAREFASRDAMLGQIATAFLVAGTLVVLAAILAGLAFARRARRRLDRVNAAYRAIAAGAIDARVDDPGGRDEIGELARHTNAMLERVGALVAAHSDMSNHLAHEIRTPLLHLDGRLLRAIEGCERDDLRDLLGAARQDIRAIVRMLDSLLDISASTARRGDSSGLVALDLSALVAETCDLFADSADELGIAFSCDLAPGIAFDGDRMQLIRMLSNLLDNAFKYTPPGGAVAVALAPGPVIAVEDDGPGVPPAMRGAIFDRFERGAFGASSNNGHGLGLSLALAIARRHGLDLSCEDSDRGARFVVRPESAGA